MRITFDTKDHQMAGRLLPPLDYPFEVFDFDYEILPVDVVSSNTGSGFFSRQQPLITFTCKVLSTNTIEYAYLFALSQLGATMRENGIVDNVLVRTEGWEYYEETIKHSATTGFYDAISTPSVDDPVTLYQFSPTLYGKLSAEYVKQTACGGLFELKFREAIQETTFACPV